MTWVVALSAKSAIRLHEDERFEMVASAATTAPVDIVRLRNDYATNKQGLPFFAQLTVEAGGPVPDLSACVRVLGGIAAPYFQVMAVAGNAAVAEPDDLLAYEVPPAELARSQFLVQRRCDMASPAITVRSLKGERVREICSAADRHPRQDRMHRAMAHFRIALNQLDGMNRLLSAEHLYIAAETLGRVIHLRLLADAGLPDTGASKHELAVKNGFHPSSATSRSHLNQYDSWVRITHIFEGAEDVYSDLKRASDGFEHGYVDFGEANEAADRIGDKPFTLIRRAILRELGIPSDSALFSEKLDRPLAMWPASIEVSGHYGDSSPGRARLSDAGKVPAMWTPFLGLNIHPSIDLITEKGEGKRDVSLKVNGNARSLSPTQSVTIKKTTWAHPTDVGAPTPPQLTGVTTDHRPGSRARRAMMLIVNKLRLRAALVNVLQALDRMS